MFEIENEKWGMGNEKCEMWKVKCEGKYFFFFLFFLILNFTPLFLS